MCLELFGFCHQLHGVADTADTVLREMLERHLTAVAVQIHTAICRGIAVCWQCVVRSTRIVSRTLTGKLTQEHASCIHHLLCQLLVVRSLDDQMLWSIGIREVDGLFLILDQHQTAVLQAFWAISFLGNNSNWRFTSA